MLLFQTNLFLTTILFDHIIDPKSYSLPSQESVMFTVMYQAIDIIENVLV